MGTRFSTEGVQHPQEDAQPSTYLQAPGPAVLAGPWPAGGQARL